jgi:hypothetical protein
VETKKLREEDGGVWLRDLRGGLKREKHGYIAKWEARARAEIARNALREGMTPDAVSKITGLDIKTVKKLAKEPVSVV